MTDLLIAALAALYVWVLFSQLHPPLIGGILARIRRSWIRPLLECAWCSGFWLAVVFTVLLHWGRWDWAATPLTALAAAGLAGLAGSFTPGMEAEDED